MAQKANRRRSGHKRHPDEWYVEESCFPDMMLTREKFYPQVREPACGLGNTVRALRRHKYDVLATDIKDRGCSGFGGFFNFLTDDDDATRGRTHDIVCNPPYGSGALAAAFIDRACQVMHRKAAFLLNDTFPYSEGRYHRFAGPNRWPIRRIYHLSSRPSMAPGEMYQDIIASGKKPSGAMPNYLWLIIERGYYGPVETRWLSLKDAA